MLARSSLLVSEDRARCVSGLLRSGPASVIQPFGAAEHMAALGPTSWADVCSIFFHQQRRSNTHPPERAESADQSAGVRVRATGSRPGRGAVAPPEPGGATRTPARCRAPRPKPSERPPARHDTTSARCPLPRGALAVGPDQTGYAPRTNIALGGRSRSHIRREGFGRRGRTIQQMERTVPAARLGGRRLRPARGGLPVPSPLRRAWQLLRAILALGRRGLVALVAGGRRHPRRVAALGGVLALLAVSWLVVRHSSLSAVRRVEVQGVSGMDSGRSSRPSSPPPGASRRSA